MTYWLGLTENGSKKLKEAMVCVVSALVFTQHNMLMNSSNVTISSTKQFGEHNPKGEATLQLS